MATTPGMEDLHQKEVFGFGQVFVNLGGTTGLVPLKVFMQSNGTLKGEPVIPDTKPDQAGSRPERVPVAERWRGVDQAV